MKPMISGLSASLLLLTGVPAFAQSSAAQQEEVVCGLLGNCADGAPAAAAPAPRTGGRASSTRGFSLARPTADPAPAATAPAAGPSRAKPSATPARAKPPAVAAPARQVPGYDLNVTFRSGSAELAGPFKTRASTFASALQDARLAGRRVRIEGHTDSVGNAASNQDLSQRRARAVADILIAAGVDAGRLDVAGFGSTQPLPGLPRTAAAQRRVVAVLVK